MREYRISPRLRLTEAEGSGWWLRIGTNRRVALSEAEMAEMREILEHFKWSDHTRKGENR